MDTHLIIKFHYQAWNKDDPNLLTIAEHLKVLKEHGKCWWGRVTAISQDRAEAIQGQISEGVPTYAFLYAVRVPTSVHPDRVLWYKAKVLEVSTSNPEKRDLIPPYYRDIELQCAFLLKDIQPIEYAPGATPKVPGQTSVRYAHLAGDPKPENLVSLSDNRQPICLVLAKEPTESSDQGTAESLLPSLGMDELKDRVIELQDEIIELQNENAELKTYKNKYNEIISTDYLFSSEAFLETWLADNIHKILPEYEIIDRQPHSAWPDGKFNRMDLMAKNKESKGLAIIEVKTRKRKAKSGYDQFLRYTTWARQNVKVLAQKYGSKGLEPSEQVEFVIVTDYVTDEMKAICKDHRIRLVHIFGGLAFDRMG